MFPLKRGKEAEKTGGGHRSHLQINQLRLAPRGRPDVETTGRKISAPQERPFEQQCFENGVNGLPCEVVTILSEDEIPLGPLEGCCEEDQRRQHTKCWVHSAASSSLMLGNVEAMAT